VGKKIDGEALKAEQGDDYRCSGLKGFIPGFEDQLVGTKLAEKGTFGSFLGLSIQGLGPFGRQEAVLMLDR